jgi:flagellar biosynthesis protein FlhF
MKVKKIVAASMPEAINRVKKELGEEAVILSSNVLWSKGILGLFKKKQVEVIAALDAAADIAPGSLPEYQAPSPSRAENETVLAELDQLKRMIEERSRWQDPNLNMYPPAIQKSLAALAAQDLDAQWLAAIGNELLDRWRNAELEPDEMDMMKAAKSLIAGKLAELDFSPNPLQRKFICLAGPTGAGKTTTLAKLAAHAVLEEKKKIAFITLDTYRIAAIEQLKTYAELLEVPVAVAYTADEFRDAAQKFVSHDHVLIDTAGRNYRDVRLVSELEGILSGISELDIFFVMAASMKERDAAQIIDHFREMGIRRFIFTKVDETDIHGPMVNTMLKYKRAAAFVTNGQEVPDDLIFATPELFANLVAGEQNR